MPALILFSLFFTLSASHAESAGKASAGKAIYLKHCASCHGKTGEGLGTLSTLPNFKDVKHMASRTDQQLFDNITHGGRGTGMPAWGKILSEQNRWDVLAYIRTFSSQ